jgi:beta-lactamase regulating signal transducer with metallopeptidase domain
MELVINFLNTCGRHWTALALPMLVQSSVLILLLLALETVLRRRVRAAVRYALWLLVWIKLVLPPTLS